MPTIYKTGQPVLYRPKDPDGNVYKEECGIVKRMSEDGTRVFVWYHSGCTAASTPIAHLTPTTRRPGHDNCHKGCLECLPLQPDQINDNIF